jgi:hypothetical protein
MRKLYLAPETMEGLKEIAKAAEGNEALLSATDCSPRCDNCRWGMELEERYDQRHCINQDSREAFGNVEASFYCQFFEANRKKNRDPKGAS